MTLTIGIDVGSSAIKFALMEIVSGEEKLIGVRTGRIRRRDPKSVIVETFEHLLEESEVSKDDLDYIATTGDGELCEFRTGHFYGMTTHARGALFLNKDANAALDIGALHARAISFDPRGKVLGYRMTSQCASGSGQFLENIVRYLGIALDEVGELSQKADNPEIVSSICAVLAETDVINMVSRGISAPNILKGIHLSMAGRFAKLLRSSGSSGLVMATGGLARDAGLIAATREEIARQGLGLEFVTHEHSPCAGAIGAAIWGAFRYEKLRQREIAGV
ncbi:MAG: benzoyl-CoA reductase subunit D [Planctomycetes bacterium]|nr:benzoyl-CoA reductase subunit D [Planctomycetota bacterium]